MTRHRSPAAWRRRHSVYGDLGPGMTILLDGRRLRVERTVRLGSGMHLYLEGGLVLQDRDRWGFVERPGDAELFGWLVPEPPSEPLR